MRFIFVDAISCLRKNRYIRGSKSVSFEEGFISRPYAKNGFLPRTLLMESIAQMASWLVIYSTDFSFQPVIATVKQIELSADVRVGSVIDIECSVTNWSEDGAVMDCTGSVEGRTVIKVCHSAMFFMPLEQLQDIDEARADFAQLARKADIS
ncbi:MAG: hypothetical protein CVU89_04570 [Firmicutes bacterium HGW-Firmicutes-14]|jgi:3-hydroxyacyl-[acyl-carrier-protein] dehydratase|nr:MAG: hypothetical protein CVU89_04570 [Firmicutes bacterium HGW-Firmicutes-14]